MKLQLYALVTPMGPAPRIGDVHGRPLRLVESHRLGALVGDVRRTPAPTRRALLAYHRVIAEVASHYTAVLPARFDAVLDDEAELAYVLQSRRPSFLRSLAHVRGRAQMTVRLAGTTAPPAALAEAAPASSGTAYLRARAASHRTLADTRECRAIRESVARWVRDERIERHNGIVTIYHLVARSGVSRYRHALHRLTLGPGVRLYVTGPFPPFAFADPFALAAPRRAPRGRRG